MAGNNQSNDGEISGINVTPLVDIMLVLVIILMVTAEFTKYRTIPIKLPKVNAAAMKTEPQKVNLTIKEDGSIWWNDKKVETIENLKDRIRAQKQLQPELAAIIRAEGETPYKEVLKLLDMVKEAGVSKVGLAVDAAKNTAR
jgi:biopolymer transport protein ExbD